MKISSAIHRRTFLSGLCLSAGFVLLCGTLSFYPKISFAEENGAGIVGMRAARDENGRFIVKELTGGYPAAQAGIKAGSEILSINGEPAKGMSMIEFMKKMSGKANTEVTLEVLNAGKKESFLLKRRETASRANEMKAADKSAREYYDLIMAGGRLTDKDAEGMEQALKKNPDDLSLRTQLLGYYQRSQYRLQGTRKLRRNHILWIIKNHPESEIAGKSECWLDRVQDKEAYDEVKGLWLKYVKEKKGNIKILGNAAEYFLIGEKDLAEDFFRQAQALDPKNPGWSERLGHLYQLGLHRMTGESRREAAVKSLEQFENAYNLNANDDMKKFYLLDNLGKMAFESGNMEKAKSYATELLEKSKLSTNDWNYGNAVHHGNLVLGRIVLKAGQIEEAKKYLIKAGETPGSPQLDSFGPNMTLAKELLDKGEKKSVIEYFKLCAKFWKMDRGRLNQWERIVEQDGVPDFEANLDY